LNNGRRAAARSKTENIQAISKLYPDATDAPKAGNMKTAYSALVVISAVMLVVSAANPATAAAFKRSYAECRDLANERGYSPGNGRALGRRGRFVYECRHGRQD
jgi:hypothetical protein